MMDVEEHMTSKINYPPETKITGMCNQCCQYYEGTYGNFDAFISSHNKQTRHTSFSVNPVIRSTAAPTTTTVRPVKAQPAGTKCMCAKCSGTGFWCKGVNNGKPMSNTGFECYSCKGRGWK